VAVGVWADIAEATGVIRLHPEVTAPTERGRATSREYAALYSALYPALQGTMHRLTALSGG
jgi:hypothetical protein